MNVAGIDAIRAELYRAEHALEYRRQAFTEASEKLRQAGSEVREQAVRVVQLREALEEVSPEPDGLPIWPDPADADVETVDAEVVDDA